MIMRILLVLLFTITLGANDKKDDGWVSLIGKNLDNWQGNVKADIKLKDGEIQLLSAKKNLWLLHKDEFANFELEVEAFMPEGAYNSGIGFRCQMKGKKVLGFQCEIDKKKSGAIYSIGKGWVLPKNKNLWGEFYKVAGDCFKDNQWNKFRIRCVGKKIEIWVNGVKTADVESTHYTKGRIAIQHHGKGGLHRFRNIRIKKLP